MILPKPKNKAYYRFKRIKQLLKNKDQLICIDGIYFSSDAVAFLHTINKKYFNYRYYGELTDGDMLELIDNNNNFREVKKDLFSLYSEYYAECWYTQFIDFLNS